ncbi:MAG: MopE-related protein, partial [Candidatus Nitrosopumilus sp. bin_68KS]
AIEEFDGVDNNCVGGIDEGFVDFDEDGYATTSTGPQEIDCDDNNAAINPGADEEDNGIDDNCVGGIDEGFDIDGDGFTPFGGDCNDNAPLVYPGADEVIDGADNNCDTIFDNIDELDQDGDGYIPGIFTQLDWIGPLPEPDGGNDCNDNNLDINPGATEIGGNGIDDNCDGILDDGVDEDGDGWVTGPGVGFDCHDRVETNPEAIYFGIDPVEINPDAQEIIGDGVDNNCNDTTDEIDLITLDDSFTGNGDSILSVSASGVLGNDIRPLYVEIPPVVYPISSLLPVDITIIDPSGNIVMNDDGSFVFSPTDPLFGIYSFDYFMEYDDTLGLSGTIITSNTASVTLTQKFCGKDMDDFDNVIVGTNSNDKLKGTNDDDLILGLAGNDKIDGKKGNDCIYGGDGNDDIKGQHGMDEIHGGDGNDKITGHHDDDIIFGDSGNDKITGQHGNDKIHGGDGNDYIKGEHGNDELFGDAGNDKISGGHDDDMIDGGDDVDYCKGDKGVNTIINCEKEDDKDGKDDKHDDKDGKDDKHDDKDGKDDKHDDKDGKDDKHDDKDGKDDKHDDKDGKDDKKSKKSKK